MHITDKCKCISSSLPFNISLLEDLNFCEKFNPESVKDFFSSKVNCRICVVPCDTITYGVSVSQAEWQASNSTVNFVNIFISNQSNTLYNDEYKCLISNMNDTKVQNLSFTNPGFQGNSVDLISTLKHLQLLNLLNNQKPLPLICVVTSVIR